MSEIAMKIKGENKISWHQNNLVLKGISGVGTEEVSFLHLIIVSWQLNLIQTLS